MEIIVPRTTINPTTEVQNNIVDYLNKILNGNYFKLYFGIETYPDVCDYYFIEYNLYCNIPDIYSCMIIYVQSISKKEEIDVIKQNLKERFEEILIDKILYSDKCDNTFDRKGNKVMSINDIVKIIKNGNRR